MQLTQNEIQFNFTKNNFAQSHITKLNTKDCKRAHISIHEVGEDKVDIICEHLYRVYYLSYVL